MASDSIWGPKSLPASGDFRTGHQFRFHTLNNAGRLVYPTLGGRALTIVQDTPVAVDQPAQCCRPGDISKIVVSGTVTAGDYITSDATGKGITASSGDQILGMALDTGTNALIRSVFQPDGAL